MRKAFNLLTTNVSHHIETSQLICIPNQLTGFYILKNIDRLWFKMKQKEFFIIFEGLSLK